MALLVCGKIPVLPPVGERDVTNVTVPSVVAVAASSGDQPLAPTIQTRSAVALRTSVGPVQVRLPAGERSSTDENSGSFGHVGPVLALAHANEVHTLIIPRRRSQDRQCSSTCANGLACFCRTNRRARLLGATSSGAEGMQEVLDG